VRGILNPAHPRERNLNLNNLGDDLVGEHLSLGLNLGGGLSLGGVELGDGGGNLHVDVSLGLGGGIGDVGIHLGLGGGNLLADRGAGVGDELLLLGDEVSDRGGVVTDGSELGADELVTVIDGLADGAEDGLVEDHHEEEELGGDDGEGKVEVENLTGLASEGGEGDEGVRGEAGEDGLAGELDLAEGSEDIASLGLHGGSDGGARAHSLAGGDLSTDKELAVNGGDSGHFYDD